MARRLSWRRLSRPQLAASLTVAAILLGALLWFRPFLTREREFPSAVPAPAALSAASQYTLAPGQQACMYSVTVEPNTRLARFQVTPGPGTKTGPPLELTVESHPYRSSSVLAAGYPAGLVTADVTPPRQPLLANVCFRNRGPGTVALAGTAEARTVSRSPTTIDGTGVVGDIALTFLQAHPSSLLDRLGTVFGHASNLTDDLLPVWLIWLIAAVCALGVPASVVLALYRALAEDEACSG